MHVRNDGTNIQNDMSMLHTNGFRHKEDCKEKCTFSVKIPRDICTGKIISLPDIESCVLSIYKIMGIIKSQEPLATMVSQAWLYQDPERHSPRRPSGGTYF
jgi:hypothetical protein